jgi:hypothetical protein
MLQVAIVVVVALLATLSGAGTALGDDCQEEEIRLQFAGNVYGSEGEVVQVTQVAVDADLIGATCTGTATVRNNESMHPGNDFIISSGGTSVVVSDFESAAGRVATATSNLVLGETITASIRLGPHGVASLAGDTVVVATVCQPTTTTTTTTTPPPAPTTSTTQPPVTTTTETPIGGVSAGGGSTAGGSGLAAALLSVGGLVLLGAFGVAGYGLRETPR